MNSFILLMALQLPLTSWLEVVLLADVFQDLWVFAEHRHSHMNTGSECGTKVGGAES